MNLNFKIMKMKMVFKMMMVAFIVSAIVATSCKRKKAEEPEVPINTSSMSTLSQDDNDVQSTSDDAMNDANDVMSRGTQKTCNLENVDIIEVVSLDSTTITYTLTFHGLNCKHNKYRTGQIQIEKMLTAKWKDSGAELKVKFINFSVKNIRTGKSITLNGFKTFKNESGGLIQDLSANSNPVVHLISGSLNVLFDNGKTKSWNVARKRTTTGLFPNGLIIKHEGFGVDGGHTNLVTWGSNRDDEQFYTEIKTAIVFKQTCDWDPISGQKKHYLPADSKSATLTFGFDVTGSLVTADKCPTHFKFDWEKGDKSGSKLVEYK